MLFRSPKVIARFGSVANLVTQVLEPTIGNYFRNAAQGSDVIDFLNHRQQRQDEAKKSISAALTASIYIPKENFGVRIENTILVTENGQLDLMANIPIEADEIEALMNRR